MTKKESIIKLRRQGLTINEIVSQIGCAKSTVSYHINNEGLGGKIISECDFHTTENEIILVSQLRNEKKTYVEIRDVTGLSIDKIKKISRIKNKNLPTYNLKKDKYDLNFVLIKYKELKSIRLTSKYFGVNRGTLRKWLPDHEVIYTGGRRVTKSQAVINWRVRKKIELVKYKGGCCEKCGYNKSCNVLQFHHIDPSQKDFTIGGKSYSIERLKKEVDKCILVCANCHIEIHEELRNAS